MMRRSAVSARRTLWLLVMGRVTSADDTPIAYTVAGDGPAVILVGGGLDDGAENEPLVAPLAATGFTVFNYARRGRAASGFTPPYALEREVEDLDALVREAGGSACLFGASSGGALALEACAAGLSVPRAAVYEVPYPVGGDDRVRWVEYVGLLDAALADGRRGDAVELFMRVAGSTEEGIAGARASQWWPGLEELAHTLAFDAACLRDGGVPASFGELTMPVLVLTGEHAAEFFVSAADALAEIVPTVERQELKAQGHVADPAVLVPMLAEYFKDQL